MYHILFIHSALMGTGVVRPSWLLGICCREHGGANKELRLGPAGAAPALPRPRGPLEQGADHGPLKGEGARDVEVRRDSRGLLGLVFL